MDFFIAFDRERRERMNSDYQVVLTKEDFSFNAAHFIAYEVIYQCIRPDSDSLMAESPLT